ncbi:MAG: hypothetical protein KDA86_19520 [Planctomycetaceae bacterium]|nr:hypothetical protein [Planctomycetaceae bacterium]
MKVPSWLRPFTRYAAILIVAMGAIELAAWWIRSLYVDMPEELPGALLFISNFQQNAAIITAVVYGYLRFILNNPLLDREYRRWLQTTPWRWPLPLPLGPMHLVWQDAVLIGLLTLQIFWHTQRWDWALAIPAVMLSVRAAWMGLYLLIGRSSWIAHLISFGIASAIAVHHVPVVSLTILAAVAVLSEVGVRVILKEFPLWHVSTGELLASIRTTIAELPPTTEAESTPRRQRWSVLRSGWFSRRTALLTSLHVGYWLFALGTLADKPADLEARKMAAFWLCLVAGGIACVRLLFYVNGRLPPLTFAGRWAQRRWIIPGYDQIFVGPFMTLFVAGLGTIVIQSFDIRLGILLPLTAGLTCLTVLAIGPDIDEFELTGDYYGRRLE